MGGGSSKDQASQPSREKHLETYQNHQMGGESSKDQALQPPSEKQSETSQNSEFNAREMTEKRTVVKLPHNWEVLVKDADVLIDKSSTEKIYDLLYAGVFLNQKKESHVYWVEKKSHANCFMLYARDLLITWSEDSRFWHWPYEKESDVIVDVAELHNVCWLEIHGKFDASMLSPGILYEFVFEVMLRDPAYGWEVPVNLRLTLPDGSKQEHKEILIEKPRGQWIEIAAGEFMASQDKLGEIECSLYEYEGGKWKRGLVIKGIVIRPKK